MFAHPHDRPDGLARLAFEAALRGLDKKATVLYESLYDVRDDLPEVHRRLTYELERFWESNNATIVQLTRAYAFAALTLVVEIVALVTLLGDTIL